MASDESSDGVEERWQSAMAAAQAGDAVAYQKLLEELLPRIRGMVRAKIFDGMGVEDVVQNALLSIHRARHTYRAERPFGPWMRTIVRNAVIDSLRERKRRAERETVVENLDLLAGSAQDPPGEFLALSPELESALTGLPPKQRQAVELIHLRELSVAEAALEAGVSASALKVRAHRGYRAMRERLKDWKRE